MIETLPYIIAKPYSGEYLGALVETIEQNGLEPKQIYTTDKWGEVARVIYQKNVDRIGHEFKVGLEGHISLVNTLFGNRAAILLLGNSDSSKTDLENTLCAAQKVKKELRAKTRGGEKLQDIVVFMNLDAIDIGCDPKDVCPTGVVGIQTPDGNFKGISSVKGTWDFYYFKYVHAPDSVPELIEELYSLQQMGVLDQENAISMQDFLLMAKLKTLIPPKMFK